MPRAPKLIGARRKSKRVDNRQSASKRGYSYRWGKYSRQRLREYPECVSCGREAEATDHIIPVTGPDDPLFWDSSNHQSLCRSCHSSKTATESNGMEIGRDNYRRAGGRG